MSAIRSSILIRARFGIPIEQTASRDRAAELRTQAVASAMQIDLRLGRGQLALITGPSGSGKSILLRAIQRLIPRCETALPISASTRKPTIDILNAPIEDRIRLLGACGLADAYPLVTPAGQLSDGQKARLSLARVFEKARSADECRTILVDEFCSTLDRTTAASVAASVRRMVHTPLRFICASANDDLIEHLRPDILVYVPLEGTPEILTRNDTCTRIPGRSCPSTSESDSHEGPGPIPGQSASARARPMTTPVSPGFTTELPPPRQSSA